MDKGEALRRYYGHSQFRPGQEALMDALLAGRDVLGVMPTGGGKSVCYQVPALLLPGTALVISPLISLMQDQVAALRESGISAAFVNSSLSGEELRETYRRAWAGEYKLIYVAPERLEAEGFSKLAQGMEVSLVAVDEAHCVSQWGQDFRPHYLRIADFIAALPKRPPVGAFTATATGMVREDVIRLLALRDPLVEVTGFDRPNLYFDVLRPRDKRAALLELLRQRRGRSGIVYCATRKGVEQVCEYLRAQGFSATRYHAGLGEAERKANQDDFRFDRAAIMVATNAFGMGIDKSNVRFVVHYNMPKSPEAYYQEAGRAGRDGEPADCILLYSPGDVATARFLIENGREDALPEGFEREEALRRDYGRLADMEGYCKTARCLRGYLLDYFGQSHSGACGNCGNCRNGLLVEDMTRRAQMILSCVVRMEDKLGYHMGAGVAAQVLRGSRNRRVLELGLSDLSVYGLMRERSARQVAEDIEALLDQGYLKKDPEHGGLSLGAEVGEVLFRGRKVERLVRADRKGDGAEKAPAKKRERTGAQRVQEAPERISEGAEEDGLFAILKALRFRLAQREKVPAFVVFSDASLADMVRKRPKSMAEFLNVSGVGEKKAEKYGPAFLIAITEFLENEADNQG